MKHLHLWLSLGLAMTLACDNAASPTEAASGSDQMGAPELSVVITPIEETVVFNEPNCAGESLELHIRQQRVVHQTVDPNGRTHIHTVINDKGTTALGLTSGLTYHQTGATVETDNFSATAPQMLTRVDVLNLISNGSAPNLLIEALFHVTINANGVEVVFISVTAITCQGK